MPLLLLLLLLWLLSHPLLACPGGGHSLPANRAAGPPRARIQPRKWKGNTRPQNGKKAWSAACSRGNCVICDAVCGRCGRCRRGRSCRWPAMTTNDDGDVSDEKDGSPPIAPTPGPVASPVYPCPPGG